MASFDPLSSFLVLLAISLEFLGNIAVYLLDLSEWRMPREYARSEYEPEEFCWYLVRWAMDGRDTAFVFGVFFSLLFSLVLLGPLDFWWHQRYRAGDERAEDLQTRSDELETRRRDDQETITQLRGENNALQSQRSEFATRLGTQQQAISSIESVNATLQSQNIDLKNKLSGEQAARQRDAAEASEAAKKSNDWIKHQDEEVVAQRRKTEAQKQEIDALRQRAETAEQTLREKDNPIKTEEQQQQKIRLELANERIEKLEQEAEERKSEQEALQEDLDTAESKEHDLKNKLKAAESERQKVQTQLEKTQTELSEARQKFNKADDNASALQKKLTAADQLIKTKAADYKKLTDDNSVTKQRCTELEQENKALNAAKKQQQEFDPKLIIELNKRVERAERKVSDATERENKLKREHSSDQNRLKQQLKTATSQKQDLEKANRIAGLTNAKLTEKYDQATSGAKRAQKLQQEHQSDHQSKLKVQQEAVFKAQSETQKAQEDLKDCQQALKSTTHEQEKLVINQNSALEAKDKEHKEAVHSKDARIATLEVCMKEATERTSDHDEKMAQAQAELKTLQDDLELKSSTIRKLQFELECASVDIQEVNNVMYLLERKTWHEYLKRQEAWILESYTIVQNHLTQAESYIECLHVAFEVLQEEHQDALKAKDEAFATQKRQYEDTARKADEDLKACHEHGKVLKSKIQQLEGSLTDECKDGEAFEEQRDITELRLSAIHSAVESQRARMAERTSREFTEREDEPRSIGLDTAFDAQLATGLDIDEPGAQESNEEGDQEAKGSGDDEELRVAEKDASDRVQRNNSGNVDESTPASEQSTYKRGSRGRGARNEVKNLQARLDAAREAIRPMPQRNVGPEEAIEQQLDTATVSSPQAPTTAGPAQPSQQRIQGLSGSRWENEPDQPIQPPQPRNSIPKGPKNQWRPQFKR